MFDRLPELLLAMAVGFIIFGPEKFPEVARRAGETWRQLRNTMDGLTREFTAELAPGLSGARRCAACGAESAASMTFCGKCGTSLARVVPMTQVRCPHCGAASQSGTKFCGECGGQLVA